MAIPGLKDVNIEKIEQIEEHVVVYVSMSKQAHCCPSCALKITMVHELSSTKSQASQMG